MWRVYVIKFIKWCVDYTWRDQLLIGGNNNFHLSCTAAAQQEDNNKEQVRTFLNNYNEWKELWRAECAHTFSRTHKHIIFGLTLAALCRIINAFGSTNCYIVLRAREREKRFSSLKVKWIFLKSPTNPSVKEFCIVFSFRIRLSSATIISRWKKLSASEQEDWRFENCMEWRGWSSRNYSLHQL